ncbi:MAG: hypothetical protein VX598_04090 [Verrucomicrobiota bacterium]|nr:hypothetical protein [Verrucomicrobiota bacterium]
MKPDHIPGRNTFTIRVGMQTPQFDGPVRGIGLANRLGNVQCQDDHQQGQTVKGHEPCQAEPDCREFPRAFHFKFREK